MYIIFFFFNDTATTEIYTLSLHDALPISPHSDGSTGRASPRGLRRSVEPRSHWRRRSRAWRRRSCRAAVPLGNRVRRRGGRSEEHTSELQSLAYLVCRLLLEKKKITKSRH